MIRAALLAVVAAAFGLALAALVAGYPLLGPVVMLGAMLVGILFERARYGALRARPGGGDWEATGECFIDDESGRPTRVWFNRTTGERRYVEDTR